MSKSWMATVAALLGTAVLAGAQGPGPSLQFSLDRAAPPLQYTLLVSRQGEGTFRPHLPTPAGSPAAPTSLEESPKTLRVGPAVVKKLFAAVPMVEGGRCETHSKGIAKTGVKTLRYTGPERDAQCTYNYSDDDRVNEATLTFEALAETMRFGERLQSKLRFDRLGLDAELDDLQEALAGGRALEVGNIAPVLNAIVQDDRVIDHARRRAEKLLATLATGESAADQGLTGASAR